MRRVGCEEAERLVPKTGVAASSPPGFKEPYRLFGDKLRQCGRALSRESAGLTLILVAF